MDKTEGAYASEKVGQAREHMQADREAKAIARRLEGMLHKW